MGVGGCFVVVIFKIVVGCEEFCNYILMVIGKVNVYIKCLFICINFLMIEGIWSIWVLEMVLNVVC